MMDTGFGIGHGVGGQRSEVRSRRSEVSRQRATGSWQEKDILETEASLDATS